MGFFKNLGSLRWNDWIRSLLSAGISAAASTLAANPIAQVLGAQEFTPRQLGIMAFSAAVVAMAGILQKTPLPSRDLAIALLPGVHTPEQVEMISKATAPGVVPSPAAAAAIIAEDKKEKP